MLNLFVFVNGIYDLLCTVVILFFPNTIIGKIHPSIFNNEIISQLNNRFLAYWLITYGSINLLIALSYFIEGFAYGYEYIYITKRLLNIKLCGFYHHH